MVRTAVTEDCDTTEREKRGDGVSVESDGSGEGRVSYGRTGTACSLIIPAGGRNDMGNRIQEFVAKEFWLLIGVVTFAVAGLVAVTGFGTLSVVIAVIGWFLLAPIFLFWGEEIAEALFREPEGPSHESGTDEQAVDELKRRYAEGEIDDAEFERRLNRLLAVDEVLDDVFHDTGTEGGIPEDNLSDPAAQGETATDASEEADTQDWERER